LRNPALAVLLCLTLAAAPLAAQQTSGPQSAVVPQGGNLKVVAVQGEGAINNIQARTATQPVVDVQDESGKPVAGAEVIFQMPAAGPGGVFNGWLRTQTVRSDAQGRAAATGMTPNDQEGRFNIKVTASLNSKSGSVVIGQSNTATGGPGVSKAKSKHRNLWITVAVLGGVAGVLTGVALTRDSSSPTVTTTTNPITITPGSISVGGPR